MGLDTTHNAWHGSYGYFYAWRVNIAKFAGYPPLELMEGYYSEDHHNMFTLLDHTYTKEDLIVSSIHRMRETLPIKWNSLKPNPLNELLYHSDCDGYISYGKCGKIAKELEKVYENLPEETEEEFSFPHSLRRRTRQFIDGLNLAYKNKEKLIFH